MITISFDVTLLDKARFKEVTRANGKKAIFCYLVLFESQNTEYGDYIVKQQVTKEEREAKKEMPILGSGKRFESRPKPEKPRPAAAKPTEPQPTPAKEGDDVPF